VRRQAEKKRKLAELGIEYDFGEVAYVSGISARVCADADSCGRKRHGRRRRRRRREGRRQHTDTVLCSVQWMLHVLALQTCVHQDHFKADSAQAASAGQFARARRAHEPHLLRA
jgi:hypothetical protein